MTVVNLHHESFGDASLPKLIILHGFFASQRNWRFIARQLADQFHVICLDLRNHGMSPHHPQMDYPCMSQDVLAFMWDHDIDRAHLLGHSMGGKIAMWFALHHAEMLDKLIVVDISPVTYQHDFHTQCEALKNLPLGELSNRKQADDYLREAIPNSEFRQFLLQNLVLHKGQYGWRINLEHFKQAGAHIVGFPEAEHLPPYLGETLVVGGEQSQYVKREAIQRWFPRAQIQEIPGAGHWVHVQAPERFLETVSKFLLA